MTWFVQRIEGSHTPAVWQVCFCKTQRTHFVDWFLQPGFRHVFMLGYLSDLDAYLLYDVQCVQSTIAVVSCETAGDLLELALIEGEVLTVEPAIAPRFHLAGRFGFWCTRAIVHALGLRCVAMTPRGLHDFLLKNGAEPLVRNDELRTLGGGTSDTEAPAGAN